MSRIAEFGAVLDALEHLEHLGLDRDVEGGRGLVGDDHVGIVGDRHGDHGPLAHAARELVRVLVGPLLRVGDADQVEQLDDPVVVGGDLRVGRGRRSPRRSGRPP